MGMVSGMTWNRVTFARMIYVTFSGWCAPLFRYRASLVLPSVPLVLVAVARFEHCPDATRVRNAYSMPHRHTHRGKLTTENNFKFIAHLHSNLSCNKIASCSMGSPIVRRASRRRTMHWLTLSFPAGKSRKLRGTVSDCCCCLVSIFSHSFYTVAVAPRNVRSKRCPSAREDVNLPVRCNRSISEKRYGKLGRTSGRRNDK